jgi:hypothetical protein
MKVEDLFEMPDFINKEMPIVTGHSIRFYSEDTIKREFDIIGKYKKDIETYWIILKKDKSAAVIGLLSNRKEDNKVGIHILGQLDFKDKPDLSFTKDIPTKEHVLQVDSVEVYSSKFQGIGFHLYLSLVKYGYIIVSDHTQYVGGRKLWEKIAKISDAKKYSVYIIANGDPILGDDGKPIEYDGSNLNDDKIWNEPTSKIPDSKKYVLLMMKKK